MLLNKDNINGECFAAFACGLQNALTTSYSGAVVRTTHLSGIITDIGNVLGMACRGGGASDLWYLFFYKLTHYYQLGN